MLKKINKNKHISIIAALAIVISKNAVSKTTLIFNKPADTPAAQLIIQKLQTAYDQLGYKVELIDFSHQNSLSAANQGVLDGQLARIGCLEHSYPNLMHSRVPLHAFSLQLITRKDQCDTCHIHQLKRLSFHQGYPFAKKYLTQQNYQGDAIATQDIATQLLLLKQSKVDGILVLDYLLQHQISAQQLSNFHITNVASEPVYHYLHKRHHTILEQLDNTLLKLYGNKKSLPFNRDHQ